MNEKVPPTASNRRKRELAREGDLLIYKRKRKTIDPSTVVPPNTVGSANEGICKGVNIPTESAEGVNIPWGSEFDIESTQAGLGAQPPLPNVYSDFDENIPIFWGYSEAGGAGNSLSLKKLKSHYAYKLEKVLSDDVSARYLVLFAKDKVAKKWPWGSTVLAHMYYNLGAASRDDARQFAYCTTLLESGIFAHFPKLGGIPKEMDSDAYKHCTCWKYDVSVTDRYGGTALLNFREALDNYKLEDTSKCDMLKETIEQMKAKIELKRVVDEQCTLEFVDLPRQLDAKCKEIESLKVVNAFLIEQIDLQLPPATPLAVLQSHQPVSGTTLAKKYEDLLAAHDNIKKKLIAKEDFEVWCQALKKALASEGMGDMGDPTFE
ncbi:hypothetical protein GIB67_024928 [Kingdonia uniflora]|uniref:Uncharacterized protein n=1 Tax=Kingdonia uniflora TaxID=39325 RepID=A0A7J7NYN7_9MAGN|nr:hypothetical protein GIB67_024928 [Kingdonia uniflora]